MRSMSINVDARGLNCPQPVIATKKALDTIAEGVITTIVDNAVSKENVVKFAKANSCDVTVAEKGDHFYITITKGAANGLSLPVVAFPEDLGGTHVFLITQNTFGHGSSELGTILIRSFFFTMVEKEPLPKTVLFANSGVKLTVKGSPVLDHLQALAARGVEVLSCGTCLDYYQLKEQLAVGGITNMYTIMDEITAHKAVTL